MFSLLRLTMNEQDIRINSIIYNLRSLLKEKSRFINKLKQEDNPEGYISWWIKTSQSNYYVRNQALETLGLINEALSKEDIIKLGKLTYKSYIKKMEIEEWALVEAIKILEQQQSKEVYLKHN